MDLSENLKNIKIRIENAASRVGRDPNTIRLIAVTKEADVESIERIIELGVKDLAENYAQQLLAKYQTLRQATWHFIGRIQTNKIRHIVPICEYIHSVCRKDELVQIDRIANKYGKVQKVLIEVNISQEQTKSGVQGSELQEILEFGSSMRNIKIVGLMTMAPFTDDFQQIRSIFRELRKLRDLHQLQHPELVHLSMGMTNDFEIAIEEGATMVRIGRAIFKGE
ncbi:MAG TPA: YggS family pyridoxal phosphate-dependent enzyme [Pseudothermotoga sp.]|nr:YggS family pyridoxal phosphate-dependent enzyme [Pseudothermotoga sp.]HOK82758.1 YggS family pyridoxal phosphate-dependent enzyme [Pseudothermotoga sp.]HPP70804.1 YggS family pyridoxal phosphate-dependent enzyme [Pseudothermotoga sp.]